MRHVGSDTVCRQFLFGRNSMLWLFACGAISHMLCKCNADMRRFGAQDCGSRKGKLFIIHGSLSFAWFCVFKKRYICIGVSVGVCCWDYIS